MKDFNNTIEVKGTLFDLKQREVIVNGLRKNVYKFNLSAYTGKRPDGTYYKGQTFFCEVWQEDLTCAISEKQQYFVGGYLSTRDYNGQEYITLKVKHMEPVIKQQHAPQVAPNNTAYQSFDDSNIPF